MLQELAAAQLSTLMDGASDCQAAPFVMRTLHSLWTSAPSLAGLHSQLHSQQQELSVCFLLIRLIAQLPGAQLSISVIQSKQDALAGIANSLGVTLETIIRQDSVSQQSLDQDISNLQRWQEAVQAAAPCLANRQSAGSCKPLLIVSHCIANIEPSQISPLKQILRTVVDYFQTRQQIEQPGSYMTQLLQMQVDLTDLDLTAALTAIIGEVIQQACAAKKLSSSQLEELQVALTVALNPALKASSGWQDHIMAQLLSESRSRQLSLVVQSQVQRVLSDSMAAPLNVLLRLPDPVNAQLVYLPPFMRERYIQHVSSMCACHIDSHQSINQFDALWDAAS